MPEEITSFKSQASSNPLEALNDHITVAGLYALEAKPDSFRSEEDVKTFLTMLNNAPAGLSMNVFRKGGLYGNSLIKQTRDWTPTLGKGFVSLQKDRNSGDYYVAVVTQAPKLELDMHALWDEMHHETTSSKATVENFVSSPAYKLAQNMMVQNNQRLAVFYARYIGGYLKNVDMFKTSYSTYDLANPTVMTQYNTISKNTQKDKIGNYITINGAVPIPRENILAFDKDNNAKVLQVSNQDVIQMVNNIEPVTLSLTLKSFIEAPKSGV